MLEEVASAYLWIWHKFFSVTWSDNEINVLNQSPSFNDVLHGYALDVQFTVNRILYRKGYYLADGIYLERAIFVKSFTCPKDPKKMQEAARKDVE